MIQTVFQVTVKILDASFLGKHGASVEQIATPNLPVITGIQVPHDSANAWTLAPARLTQADFAPTPEYSNPSFRIQISYMLSST